MGKISVMTILQIGRRRLRGLLYVARDTDEGLDHRADNEVRRHRAQGGAGRGDRQDAREGGRCLSSISSDRRDPAPARRRIREPHGAELSDTALGWLQQDLLDRVARASRRDHHRAFPHDREGRARRQGEGDDSRLVARGGCEILSGCARLCKTQRL